MSDTTLRPPSRLLLRIAARGRLVDRVSREWFDLRLRRRKARHRRRRATPSTKTVVHLVGCQRSGTDMSLDLLARSMDVDVFNEDHAAAFSRCRIRGADVISRVVERTRAPFIIFKPICDSHRVIDLLSWHEPSRAVWLYRDYRGVANSAVVKWGDTNLRHLRQLLAGGGDWGWSQWHREGCTEQTLAQVRDLVDDNLTPHEAAAIQWYLLNQCFFSQGLQERDDVAIFRYEDLVTDPGRQFGRMCRFLGITFSEEMAATVHARSVSKGRDVVLAPGIEELCAGMLARLDAEARRQATEGRA